MSSTVKPRIENLWLPKLRAVLVTPVVWASASSSVVRFLSSSCCRVITLTDCGVSRIDCVILPMVSAPLVYDPVSSVVGSRRLPPLTVTACSVTASLEDWPGLAAAVRVNTSGRLLLTRTCVPASNWSSASRGVRRPLTAGAWCPATTASSNSTWCRDCSENSLRARSSGCAGMLNCTDSAGCCACAAGAARTASAPATSIGNALACMPTVNAPPASALFNVPRPIPTPAHCC